MLGTLNGALEVRGLNLPGDAITARVQGVNELRDGIPVLTKILVQYHVRVSAAKRDVLDRALAKHQLKCPTAQSLKAAVDISWAAHVDEAEGD